MFRWWREKDIAIAKDKGLLLVGHCSDGDRRLVACDFFLNRELGNDSAEFREWLHSRVGVDHVLLDFLKVAVTKEGHRKLGFQDWLHLLWRWRRHLLDTKRNMQLGPGLNVDWQDLEDAVGVGPGKPLKDGDLDLQDKQNWGATDRIFSQETLMYLLDKIEAKATQEEASQVQTEWRVKRTN